MTDRKPMRHFFDHMENQAIEMERRMEWDTLSDADKEKAAKMLARRYEDDAKRVERRAKAEQAAKDKAKRAAEEKRVREANALANEHRIWAPLVGATIVDVKVTSMVGSWSADAIVLHLEDGRTAAIEASGSPYDTDGEAVLYLTIREAE